MRRAHACMHTYPVIYCFLFLSPEGGREVGGGGSPLYRSNHVLPISEKKKMTQ